MSAAEDAGAVELAEDLVTEFEGFSAAPYRDVGGTWTIGYGSIWDYRVNIIRPPRVTGITRPVTDTVARLMVAFELTDAIRFISHLVHVMLSPQAEAALADFVFNLGAGNFAASTLLRKLNRGDFTGAAAEFDKWDHAGGVELAGLLRRREAERKLFDTSPLSLPHTENVAQQAEHRE